MKKIILKVIMILLIAIILLNENVAIAATKSQLQNSNSETQKKIDEAKEHLEDIQETKSEAMKQVQSLTAQITDYQTQIDTLRLKIEDLNKKINDAQTKINKAQEDYNKQEELLNARLVATYEAGETSYLDVILSSESITDLISNYYLVTELATTDTELMKKIQGQKAEIEKAKQELEGSKQELATSKASKQSVATQLKDKKNEKDAQVANLSAEEKQTQADLEQFEADKRQITNELARIAREEEEARKKAQSSGSSTNLKPIVSKPSSSGYIFPVAGLSKANINNKNYPSYPGHTGIDVNINVSGKTIVAVKSGTVYKSMAYKINGKYYSYGECIIINHHDGTMTLYAHGAPGSRKVSNGQSVSQGQPLMTVGTTGNSSGEHLHFEVRVNGITVNPLPYLP